ncbi:Concanavalin A-like lectin/glucanases superfamily [Penicillium cf. griseofulvum]|uniref:Concanavalin A-like lectin/glucanases superfamily n=1 Tax=Penicillium cf. griseofulvum TaxID=2972120 RepID=A0A9W9IWU0_9EURO|nr:Concanavalin A-like lectin/glucanases superfamily [Penicillium cf. griseofulvum]KAJ5429502.1 Concanavalin A-like lectin/glucanases superfamily [Penicillium cf. griseofulvum]KAJ5436717.1 Concanavalin A-like lectin/glucanases superfamily [Penicillium cf. griseofulvum]
MKFSTTILSALLTTVAIAAPLTERRAARNAARADHRISRISRPPYKPDTKELLALNGTVHEEYSTNWAGAVLIGTGYTSVTGQFTVPTPKLPAGVSSSEQYCASAWVGIDGDTCSTAILQTGIDFCIQGSQVSYDAWYEWYPDYAYDFSGLSISAGDVIEVTVTATSKTAGTAVIKNVTTGKSVTHTFTGGVDGDLCEYNAEWIVEDYESGGELVPFVNFGTVTFTNAKATTGGKTVGPSGSTLMDIKQNNVVLTKSSLTSSSVSVSYV